MDFPNVGHFLDLYVHYAGWLLIAAVGLVGIWWAYRGEHDWTWHGWDRDTRIPPVDPVTQHRRDHPGHSSGQTKLRDRPIYYCIDCSWCGPYKSENHHHHIERAVRKAFGFDLPYTTSTPDQPYDYEKDGI